MRHLLLPFFLASLDIISAIIAALVSISLRFDGNVIPQNYLAMLISQLPVFVGITIASFFLFKLYSRVWRYAGSSELLAIIGANLTGSVCWFIFSFAFEVVLPRSIYILTALILTFFVGGTRLALRVYSYLTSKPKYIQKLHKLNKVLVIGAGDAAAMLAREIERYHSGKRKIVGFIDDDKDKHGKTMLGIKVLGSRCEIEKIAADTAANEIIIAMPSVKGKDIKEIIDICKKTNCKLTILPGVYEIIEGTVSVNQLRPVEVEDLLGRDPVKLDTTDISSYLTEKVVLITGAGGSIGSEICRQIAKMKPQKMLLLGKGENSIYEIAQELSIEYPQIKKVPIIADVRDRERMQGVMEYFRPQVVFHAAAHKHVPLMEYQPMEAVRNNVLGTKVVAEEAAAHDVETFVMISTDKAVNPTSVMGCTKRIAEMFVQTMNIVSKTRFVAVRFGNVLGSRGSVIPLFKKQIAKGGPITVTDPEMKRYFMTIPEASQLVLQAGAMAKGGEVFVLDMGEPVKIYDLARDLVTLSGMIPEVDIEIEFTGLRPGEKLFEELLSAEDGTEVTSHKKIFTAKIRHIDKVKLDQQISILLEQADGDKVVDILKQIVPTYNPNRINC